MDSLMIQNTRHTHSRSFSTHRCAASIQNIDKTNIILLLKLNENEFSYFLLLMVYVGAINIMMPINELVINGNIKAKHANDDFCLQIV